MLDFEMCNVISSIFKSVNEIYNCGYYNESSFPVFFFTVFIRYFTKQYCHK